MALVGFVVKHSRLGILQGKACLAHSVRESMLVWSLRSAGSSFPCSLGGSTVPGDRATHRQVLLSFGSTTLEKGLQPRAAEGDPADFTSSKVSDSPSKATLHGCLSGWILRRLYLPQGGWSLGLMIWESSMNNELLVHGMGKAATGSQ